MGSQGNNAAGDPAQSGSTAGAGKTQDGSENAAGTGKTQDGNENAAGAGKMQDENENSADTGKTQNGNENAAGTGKTQGQSGNTSGTVDGRVVDVNNVDLDLTAMSSTMVYAQVYNMMVAPDQYLGKTVKMKGPFAHYHDDTTGNDYFACIIQDATACCQQGMEFVLAGEHVYPDDYPQSGEEICVVGVFSLYKEDNYVYAVLLDAVMVSDP